MTFEKIKKNISNGKSASLSQAHIVMYLPTHVFRFQKRYDAFMTSLASSPPLPVFRSYFTGLGQDPDLVHMKSFKAEKNEVQGRRDN